MKKNPYLTFSLVAGGILVAYLVFKKKTIMAVPQNVDVEKPKTSSTGGSGGGAGGGMSIPRMSAPITPIITPPVVVVPQTTIQPTTPQAPNNVPPTKTTVDNPDAILGGAVVPPSTTTIQTSSGTLAVKTTEPSNPNPPALGKVGGISG